MDLPAMTLPQAPSREVCFWCGIPGFRAWAHFAPFVAQVHVAPDPEARSARHHGNYRRRPERGED